MASLEDKFLNKDTPLTEKAGGKKKGGHIRSPIVQRTVDTDNGNIPSPLAVKAGGKKKGGHIRSPIVQ
jgi:hypothetical protein